MKISAAIDTFLDFQKVKGNSDKTIIYYNINLTRFLNFVNDIELEEITPEILKGYMHHLHDMKRHENNSIITDEDKKSRKISSISVQTYTRALRAFISWLFKEELVKTNFLPMVPLPKARKKVVKILENEQVEAIYKSFDTNTKSGYRNLAIFTLLLDSGMRLGELINIKINDIDFKNSRIKVLGKGDKERLVCIGNRTKTILIKYMEKYRDGTSCSSLFTSGSKPITDNAIKCMFLKISANTGIKVHAHLLRHTFATKFLQSGGGEFGLQNLLGHTSLEIVRRYCHMSNMYACDKAKEHSIIDGLYVKKKG